MDNILGPLFAFLFNNQFALLASEAGSAIVKVVVLFGLLLYMGFSILIIRQVQLMTRTVTGELDRFMSTLSWGHFLMSAGVFLLVLVFL